MALFNKKTNSKVSNTDNATNDNHTWQSEVARDLEVIMDALRDHSPDEKVVARELRRLHLDYYADKLEGLGYHADAKHRNKSKVGAKRV